MIHQRDFIFVRHGEAEGNVRNICQGRTDLPLTDNGRIQAHEAAAILLPYSGKVSLFSSTLQRASETAQIIASKIDHRHLEFLDGLQERGYGVLEGRPNTAMHAFEERELKEDFKEPSGIEGLEERSAFEQRIVNVMNDILGRSNPELPLIVGHGRFFFYLCEFLGIPSLLQLGNAIPVRCSRKSTCWEVNFLS